MRTIVLVRLSIYFLCLVLINPQISFSGQYEDISNLIAKKSFSKAEVLCKRELTINPGNVALTARMGEICWAQNKKRRAIKFFRKAVKINPEYPVPYFFLGKIYFAERKPEKGREQFSLFEKKMESFLAGDGSASDYYTARLHDICYLYATQKWYQKTKRICRKIIKLDPDDPKAHYNMAVCYYIHDNSRSRAYNELVKVKELAPDTRIADKAEFYIDYIRCNPDSRIIGDFTFLDED